MGCIPSKTVAAQPKLQDSSSDEDEPEQSWSNELDLDQHHTEVAHQINFKRNITARQYLNFISGMPDSGTGSVSCPALVPREYYITDLISNEVKRLRKHELVHSIVSVADNIAEDHSDRTPTRMASWWLSHETPGATCPYLIVTNTGTTLAEYRELIEYVDGSAASSHQSALPNCPWQSYLCYITLDRAMAISNHPTVDFMGPNAGSGSFDYSVGSFGELYPESEDAQERLNRWEDQEGRARTKIF